jgi:hypothetical protein
LLVALLALALTTPSAVIPGAAPVNAPVTAAALVHHAAPRHHRAHHRHHRLTIPHAGAWACIHSHEASTWNIANPPYYGGLQMDLSFQQAYGSRYLRTEGTANRWTPAQQMLAAEHAWRTRGFSPWTNTARMCGLPA